MMMLVIIAFSCREYTHQRDSEKITERIKWMCHFWISNMFIYFRWLKSATTSSTYTMLKHVLLFMPICYGFLIATCRFGWLLRFLTLCVDADRRRFTWTLCTHQNPYSTKLLNRTITALKKFFWPKKQKTKQ